MAQEKKWTFREVWEATPTKKCKWCGEELKFADLDFWGKHDGGIKLKGIDDKQWVYVICQPCEYEWSIYKLGFREEGK